MQRKEVLLIEDDHALGASISEYLKLTHSVSWATSADDAFKALAHRSFDIAILDLALGSDSAVTLLKALNRFGKPVPPLIICSAQPIGMIREAVEETGAMIALQKPCSCKVINEAIDLLTRQPNKIGAPGDARRPG